MRSVRSTRQGILAQAILVGDVHLINLTVAGNSNTGIVLGQTESAVLTLYNTISFDNGVDLATSGTVGTG